MTRSFEGLCEQHAYYICAVEGWGMEIAMQKERVEVFERKMLTDGVRRGALYKVGRAGRGFVRITALGVSVFALIFIMCCFFIGSDMASDDQNSAVSPMPSETLAPEEKPVSTDNNELLAILRQILGFISDSSEPADIPDIQKPDISDTEAAAPPASPDAPDEDIYSFDRTAVPEGETAIIPYDLSLSSYGTNYIYNDTSYSPSVPELMKTYNLPKFDYINAAIYPVGDPVVLIIHTHGTEAYSPEGSISYDENSPLARSSDVSENVVAIGETIAEVLNKNNIRTLHCTVMHDEQSYRDSYNRSAATILEYMEKYPSIQYVIDVHRDSVTNSSGELLRPITQVDEKTTAQVMCVVGSDLGGAENPNWQNNLSFALKLRASLNEMDKKLCRPVCLRSSAYNQQYAPVSILLEVGTSGNYLSEAKEAARLCAVALAGIIKN